MILDFDPSAKVIIVTQFDDPDYREEASRLGTIVYVLKDDLIHIPQKIIESDAKN